MAEKGRAYDAFLSYAHEDGVVAEAVEKGLQRFAKRWNQRRALHIFRDASHLSATNDLWESIRVGLDSSEWLIVLCSPESAASPYVTREVTHWIDTRGTDRILLAVTAGTLQWDDVNGRIDLARSNAVDPAVAARFDTVAFHIDLTDCRDRTDLTLKDATFRDHIADLAAPLHGKEKNEIAGEDLRQQRRTLRLARGAVLLLSLLTVAALISGALALRAQREAEAQQAKAEQEARRATSQALAARSIAFAGNRLDHRLLLATQAWATDETPEARAALLSGLIAARNTVTYLHGFENQVAVVALSEDGRRVAVVGVGGQVQVIDIATGDEVPTDVEPAPTTMATFVGDETLLLAGPLTATAVDLTTGKSREVVNLVEENDGETSVVNGGPQINGLDRRGFVVVGKDYPTVGDLDLVTLDGERRSVDEAAFTEGATPEMLADGTMAAVSLAYDEPAPFGEAIPVDVEVADLSTGATWAAATVSMVTSDDELQGGLGGDSSYPRLLGIDVDRDTERLAVASPGRLEVIDLADDTATTVDIPTTSGRMSHVGFSDGYVVVTFGDGSTVVHDPETGAVADAGGLDGWVRSLATSPSGRAAVGGEGDAVEIVDVRGERLGSPLPVELGPCTGDCLGLADDRRAAVVTDDGAVLASVDADPKALPTDDDAVSVDVAPDGRTAAVGTDDETVVVGDPASWQSAAEHDVSSTFDGPAESAGTRALAFDADGSVLAADGAIIDVASGDVRGADATLAINHVELTPDGSVALAVGQRSVPVKRDGELGTDRPQRDPEIGVTVPDLAALRTLDPSPEAEAACGDQADRVDRDVCGPPAELFARSSEDAAGVASRVSSPASAPLNTVAFSGDDELVIGSDRGIVLTRQRAELESGVAVAGPIVRRAQVGGEDIWALTPLYDGEVLAVGTESGIRLFDAVLTTDLGQVAAGRGDGTTGLAVNAAGTALVVGETGRAPLVVPLEPEQLVERLCRTANRNLDTAERGILGLEEDDALGCPDEPAPATRDLSVGDGDADVVTTTTAGSEEGGGADPEGGATTTEPPEGTYATLEEFAEATVVEDYAATYVGNCDDVAAGGTDLWCSEVRRETDTEAVVMIAKPFSDVASFYLLERSDGRWTVAEEYTPSGEMGVGEEPGPDWLN